MTARKMSTVSRILVCQIVVTLLAMAGFAAVQGWRQAYSCALGGLVAFLPNLYFAWQMRRAAGQAARKVANAFYFGEAGKWVLTIALFAMAFRLPNMEIIPLLATYILAISVFWFALLMR